MKIINWNRHGRILWLKCYIHFTWASIMILCCLLPWLMAFALEMSRAYYTDKVIVIKQHHNLHHITMIEQQQQMKRDAYNQYLKQIHRYNQRVDLYRYYLRWCQQLLCLPTHSMYWQQVEFEPHIGGKNPKVFYDIEGTVVGLFGFIQTLAFG